MVNANADSCINCKPIEAQARNTGLVKAFVATDRFVEQQDDRAQIGNQYTDKGMKPWRVGEKINRNSQSES